MIEALLMILLGLILLLFTYRLRKKVNGNPCVKFRDLLLHNDFKSILLLFIVTFSSFTLMYIFLAMEGITFSPVLGVTNSILLITSFYWMQHLIKK